MLRTLHERLKSPVGNSTAFSKVVINQQPIATKTVKLLSQRLKRLSLHCGDQRHSEFLCFGRRPNRTWWRHQMETFSALPAFCVGNSPVTGEFLTQRPVTRSFDVFFDLHLNKRLRKQSWGWWFETLSFALWRHCNEVTVGECWRLQCIVQSTPVKQCTAIHVINGNSIALIARFMGPTWGPSGADRTQVGPMLAPWTLSGHRWFLSQKGQ